MCQTVQLIHLGTLRFIGSLLVFCGLQVNGRLARLFRFQCGGLGSAAWYRIKGGTAKQVFKIFTRSEKDAHTRDVLGGERLTVFRTLAGQRQPEVAEVIQHDFLALQQLFHEAAAHVGQTPFT